MEPEDKPRESVWEIYYWHNTICPVPELCVVSGQLSNCHIKFLIDSNVKTNSPSL